MRQTDSVPDRESQAAEAPAPLVRTLVLCAAAIAAGVGVGVVRWIDPAPAETFVGRLQTGATPVVAERDATLLEILAAAGTTVDAGAPLVRLRDDTLPERLAAVRDEVAAVELELAAARARAVLELTDHMQALDAELHATRLRTTGLLQTQFDCQLELRAWEEFLARRRDANPGVTPASWPVDSNTAPRPDDPRLRAVLQEESTRNAAEVAAAQLELCQARLRQLEEAKGALAASVRQACGVDRLEARLATLERERTELEARPAEWVISSPAYGTVGVVRHQAGESIAAGEVLFELLDDQQRIVVLPLPTRRVDRFAPDDPVVLVFPGGEERHGIVQSIPPQATAGDGACVEVTIAPTGKLWPDVPAGTAIEVVPARR